MYLIPRLIGVGIYALFCAYTCLVIYKVKGLKFHLFFYTLILALMGFFYVPLSGSDLPRTTLSMKAYTNLEFSDLIYKMQYNASPLVVVYYHMIGKLGDERWLPFINAFVTYSFCFNIIVRINNKLNPKRAHIALALFFFMARGLLMMTIANIRTMLALSIISYGIYKVLIENRNLLKYIQYFIIGSLLHTTGLAASIIFLLYYLVFILIKKRKMLFTILYSLIITVIYIYGKNYFDMALEKGTSYYEYGQIGIGYFYFWEMLLSIIVIITTLILLFFYKKNMVNRTKTNNNDLNDDLFSEFTGFMFAFSLFLLFIIFIEFNIGLRLSWLLTILDIPLIIIILSSDEIKQMKKNKIIKFILLVCFVLLFIACSRGDLSSLKFM